ncbi:uncharacterized protein LOC118417384 [Branchiostoma floridae]|uniref:Uncharacterized protein LOC118417384 n=1 Tax=Branchiostoma floridae TaxID=7739 RepID=A0A9J7L9R8_BRAFL|nr:uncharacterized protein LOC118417384 [Branchiostoma floridae]
MVMKQCPACAQQIPVACKSCPCGHLFMSKRPLNPKPLSAASDVSHEDSREGEEQVVLLLLLFTDVSHEDSREGEEQVVLLLLLLLLFTDVSHEDSRDGEEQVVLLLLLLLLFTDVSHDDSRDGEEQVVLLLLLFTDVSHEDSREGEEQVVLLLLLLLLFTDVSHEDSREGEEHFLVNREGVIATHTIRHIGAHQQRVALEADRDDTNSNFSEASGASASADQGEGAPRKKRPGRPKGTVSKNKEGNSAEKEKNAEEEMFNNLTLEQKLLYSIALADINHKLRGQRFKIPD